MIRALKLLNLLKTLFMKIQKLGNTLLFAILLLLAYACSDDDDMQMQDNTSFKVTIENILPDNVYLASGTTGFIGPGENFSFSFNAGKGSMLSLATMFVQTNDLFYAPDENGIPLYDETGKALVGDITTKFDLWDAGTEVNQEPGVGADQAPRQAGANTGTAENGTVQLIANVNDGFTYPADEEIIRIEIAHDENTMFTVTVNNISNSSVLPTPLAPGVYVIHGSGNPLFVSGEVASEGLEDVAEDGSNEILAAALGQITAYTSPFAPGVYAIHNNTVTPLFQQGSADFGEGLEALAEDGDPATLGTTLAAKADLTTSGVFNTPVGTSGAGPIISGQSYEFTFEGKVGDYLSLATMLVHTNDLFYAFDDNGIALFDNNDNAISGDITSSIQLWDAGTEVNEYPGAGNNQPARGGSDSGTDENGVVQVVNDDFTYPAVNNSIRITIMPQ